MEEVRLARSTDLSTVQQLDQECFPDNCHMNIPPPNGPKDWNADPDKSLFNEMVNYHQAWSNIHNDASQRIFVKTLMNRVVAFTHVLMTPIVKPEEIHVEKMAVTAKFRNHGFSRELMGQVYDWAFTLRCKKLVIWPTREHLSYSTPVGCPDWVKNMGFTFTSEEKVAYHVYGEPVYAVRCERPIDH